MDKMGRNSGNYYEKDSSYGRSDPRELCRKEIYGGGVCGFWIVF